MLKTLVRWVSLAVWMVGVAVGDPLPAGWSSVDIGGMTPAGTTAYAMATAGFELTGAGADIWGSADQFHYVYQSWTGDGQWIVRIGSVQNTNAWAKAGIMVRSDLTAGAANVMLALTSGNGVTFQRRKASGGTSSYNSIPAVTAPGWIKLVRRGDQFDAYTSADGETWVYFTTDTVSMSAGVQVGLAVTSHHAGVLAGASFTQFTSSSVTAGPLPDGWSAADVGGVAPLGVEAYTPATAQFDLKGAGADIWGPADQFHYVYESWSGDGQWIVRIDSVQNTNAWAKAGIMVRENLLAGSRHAMLALTPGNGVAFERRKVADGASLNTNASGATAPGWLKLVRKGNQFDCYTSPDGQTWSYWTTDVVDMPAGVLVGLAITSHHAGVLAGASFAHFDATVPLPPDFLDNWTSVDIGGPALSGMADYQDSDGLLTLRGAGADIWGTVDQCQFAYVNWTGNAVLVTRVESLQNTNAWAKAGVMIRAGLDAGAAQAMVALTPGNGVAFQRRTTTGGSSLNTAIASIATPGWVKLARWGDRFDGFYSTDGLTWKYLGSQTIVMPPAVYIGLALTSHSANVLTQAEFSHLTYSLTGAPGGLWGEYFSGKAFNTPVLQRLDDTVNFSWGTGSPSPGVPLDAFSARWTGWLKPDVTQPYTLYTVSDDGVRLWIDGQLLIDNWTNHGAVTNSATITLNAGMAYAVKMEYYENTGGATAQLQWSAADRGKTAIPAPFLVPSQYPNLAGDGIPDYWKALHGLEVNTALDPNAIDPATVDSEGAGGLTYLQEYGGSVAPLMTVLGGDQQTAASGLFNADPFDIAVWKSDGSGPLVNTPVTFTVTSGGGLLAATSTTTPPLSASIVVNTDQDGTAQAYYQQPATDGVSSQITVTAGGAAATFTTTSLSEAVPAGVTAQAISPTQILLAWSGDQAATSYTIDRQTGDGDFETIAVVDNVLGYIDSGLAAGETYTYRLRAQSHAVESAYTDPITATTLATGADFPAGALRMWLKADAGVVASDTGVSLWLDQSGHGNNASQEDAGSQPQWVADQLSGKPVIRFNGSQMLNLPDVMAGATEGEVIAVVKVADKTLGGYDDTNNKLWNFNQSGTGYGQDQPGLTYYQYNTFGTDDFDHGLEVPVSLVSNYHIFDTSCSLELWAEYYNGVLADSGATEGPITFTTAPNLGAGVFAGDFAEILVFDHALSDDERAAVMAWLNTRYVIGAPSTAPDAPTGVTARPLSSTQISLSWTGDTGSTYTIERTTGDGDYEVIGTAANGPIYIDDGLEAGTGYTYRIKVSQAGADSSYSAPVAATTLTTGADFPVAGMKLWLKADAGVITSDGGVSLWKDQSGHGNDASPDDSTDLPQWVAGQVGGLPVVRFSGSQQLNLPDVMSGATAGEIVAVVKVVDKTQGGYDDTNNKLWNFNQSGVGYEEGEPGSTYYHYNTFGTDDDDHGSEVPVALVSNYHIFDTSCSPELWAEYYNGVLQTSGPGQTATFTPSPNLGSGVFAGDFAEILVFDHVLSAAERATVVALLHTKYAIVVPPVTLDGPTGVTAQPLSSTQIGLSWIGDTGSTYTIERATGDGEYELIGTVENGSFYIDGGLEAGTSYTYRIKANLAGIGFGYSNLITGTTRTTGADFPLGNMRMWLKADAGVVASDGAVSLWRDQSGHGNNASQDYLARQPYVVAGQINSLPVIRFTGDNQVLYLPDVMANATEGEIIAVVKVIDKTQGGYDDTNNKLWNFNQSGVGYEEGVIGAAYYHYNTFGTDDDDHGSSVPIPLVSHYHIFDTSCSPERWAEYYNGVLQRSGPGQAATFTSSPELGSGVFAGDFAEILVFDHVLTSSERHTVQVWLNTRYAIAPEAPVLAAHAASANRIDLSWGAALGNEQDIIAILERQTGAGAFLPIATGSNIYNYADDGLTPGQVYTYRVKLEGDGGISSYSNPVTLATLVNVTGIPTTGLRLWLRSTAGVQSQSSGSVAAWLDQSGSANDATQANLGQQPQLVSNAVNGFPGIRFDGNQQLNLPDLMSGASAGEIIAVLKVDDKVPGQYSNNNNQVWNFGSPLGYYYDQLGAATYHRYNGFGLEAPQDADDFPKSLVSAYHIHDTASSGLVWTERYNGIVYASAINQPVYFSANPQLGANFVGDFAEIIVYDHVLSEENRLAIEAYLKLKYEIGVSVPIDSAPPSVPQPLTSALGMATQVTLLWPIATDNIGVTGYDLYRDGQLIASMAGTTYTATGLFPATTYQFTVRARDAAGNLSAFSQALAVTTLPYAGPVHLDTDGDGIPDTWESAHGLDPNSAIDAAGDPDGDGLINLAEYLTGADPQRATTSDSANTAALHVIWP